MAGRVGAVHPAPILFSPASGMDRPTFALTDDDLHEPVSHFIGLDDDDVEDQTAARVARRYRAAIGRVSKVIREAGTITKPDVIRLLAGRGIAVAAVTWGSAIDAAVMAIVGLDEAGREIVNGTVSLRLRPDGDRLVVDAALVVLDDGDIPF
jgi:hypothetical protein